MFSYLVLIEQIGHVLKIHLSGGTVFTEILVRPQHIANIYSSNSQFQEEMLDCMRQISTALPTILQSIHASSQAHPCYQHQLSQPISQPMPQHSHTLPTTSMPHLQQQQSAAQSVRTGSVDNGLDENLGTVPPTNQQQRPSPAEVIAEPLSDLAVAQRIPSRQISLAEGLAGRQPILGGGLFPDAVIRYLSYIN